MGIFIIVRSDADEPRHTYDEDKKVYLCITESGKTVVCKYVGGVTKWENASYWRDGLGKVVAYQEIVMPADVIDEVERRGKRKVDYYVSLR